MAKKRTLYTICTVVFMVGIALFVFNAENIKYNSFFNEDSVSDRANEMRRNYSILGYSFDSTTRDLYKEIYAKDANSGNTAIMGIAICIVSSVIAIIVYIYLYTSILLSPAASPKVKRCDAKVSPTPPCQTSQLLFYGVQLAKGM